MCLAQEWVLHCYLWRVVLTSARSRAPASCTSQFSRAWGKPLVCYNQALQSSISFIMMMQGLVLQEADQIKDVAQDLACGRSQVCAWYMNVHGTWGNAYTRVGRLKTMRPSVVKITIVNFKKHRGIFLCVCVCVCSCKCTCVFIHVHRACVYVCS